MASSCVTASDISTTNRLTVVCSNCDDQDDFVDAFEGSGLPENLDASNGELRVFIRYRNSIGIWAAYPMPWNKICQHNWEESAENNWSEVQAALAEIAQRLAADSSGGTVFPPTFPGGGIGDEGGDFRRCLDTETNTVIQIVTVCDPNGNCISWRAPLTTTSIVMAPAC